MIIFWIQWQLSHQDKAISIFDLSPSGEAAATIESNGLCLVSDLNSDSWSFPVEMGEIGKLAFQTTSC